MMNQRRQNLLYLVASLILASLLFLYTTMNNYQSSSSANSTTSETYTNTINNVPIAISYDNTKYFVSGFTSDVTVQLTSANRLTLQKEVQDATRSFRVTADFSGIESGTHDIPLKIENVPDGVTASISPETINVKIGRRVSQEFEVESQLEPSQVEEGVTVSSIETEATSVEVVTDEDTMSKVAKVIAKLPSEDTISDNYTETVTLQAVDAEGNYLPSIISPGETNLIIKVKKN